MLIEKKHDIWEKWNATSNLNGVFSSMYYLKGIIITNRFCGRNFFQYADNDNEDGSSPGPSGVNNAAVKGTVTRAVSNMDSSVSVSLIISKQFYWLAHWKYTAYKFINDIRCSLTGGNWQKWKRVFLTCPCHEIYRDEAVSLKSCKNTWKITIFVKMWNLGQYRENLIFCQ